MKVRLVLVVVGVVLVVAAATLALRPAAGPPPPVLDIGGNFTLTDQDGHAFQLSSLHGDVVLIFFGYTYCPDACPTTLSKLSVVARRLGRDARHVKTVYITVDPDRDTPAVMKADLANFAIDSVGLTGTRAEIDRVVRQYGAAYEIVPEPGSAARYGVSHSTTLYALDGLGRTRILFRYEATVDEIVAGIRSILADGSSS